MNAYESKKRFKYLFLITAMLIAIVSMWISNALIDELKVEERKKIENWAEAIRIMSTQILPDDVDPELFNEYDKFLIKLAEDNTTIPVIMTGSEGDIMESQNIRLPEDEDEAQQVLEQRVGKLKKKRSPITIELDENTRQYVYYDDSSVLKQLQIFPFIQMFVLFVFIAVSFIALTGTQRAEQNKVWVGLSKETAHQLGTPISSLMAWVEYLKTKDTDSKYLTEMDKDVQRLKIIAERFSKIGSNPEPEPMNLYQSVLNAVGYMERRISSKVNISIDIPDRETLILMNDSLFSWTLENLIKNGVDAMDGKGEIHISSGSKGNRILLDISDTGKGIPKSKFDAVFQPGYTTKKRGWGLGLSLVRRIIENYSQGKIYILRSEPGKGTTFRIELKKIGA